MLKQAAALFAIVIWLQSAGIALPKEIRLSSPKIPGKVSLEDSILKRRSIRAFYPNELNNQQISQLLWAGQGITDPTWGLRSAPSAGSIYPITLYLCDKNGVYEYLPKEHKLILIAEGDKRPQLTRSSLGQTFISEAPVSIIVAADFDKNRPTYGTSRGPRFVLMEAGHVAQNIELQAIALGLGSVPVGAFWENVAQSALSIPKDQNPLYIIPIGYPRE